MTTDFWITNWLLKDTIAGLRVGQSYMVRVRPDLTDASLFYETCVDDAWKKINSYEQDRN